MGPMMHRERPPDEPHRSRAAAFSRGRPGRVERIRRAGGVWLAMLACLTSAQGHADGSATIPSRAGEGVLEGEWYVLAHFTEESAASDSSVLASDGGDDARRPGDAAPREQTWRDEVWRFEQRGDRLRWTVLSELGFRDESGRYEEVRGARARIAHAWRPSPAQLAEIRHGLELEERSARTRTLRTSDSGAWRSAEGARLGSASAVAYGEQWSIEAAEQGPSFVRRAMLRSGRAGSLEGVTRFDSELVDAEGGYVEGRFARDGRERGRFFMWRKGRSSARDLELAAPPDDGGLFGPGGAARMSVVELEARLAANDDSREQRLAIRAGIRELVEERYARRGLAARPHADEIDALTSEIERLAVVEGVSLAEIDRRLRSGELAP